MPGAEGAAGSGSNEPEEPDQPPQSSGSTFDLQAASDLDACTDDDLAWLRGNAGSVLGILAGEGHSIARVSVRLVGDREMSEMHLRYSGDAETTDVLGFVAVERPLEMDILACVDVAKSHAAAGGHAVRSELLLYIVHGLLHALGFDDRNAEESARMHAEEDRLLELIGVGAVWRRGGAS